MRSIGTSTKKKKVMIVSIDGTTHLYWKADKTRFVTLCSDGSVIFDGKIMSLAEATAILLDEDFPTSLLWDK